MIGFTAVFIGSEGSGITSLIHKVLKYGKPEKSIGRIAKFFSGHPLANKVRVGMWDVPEPVRIKAYIAKSDVIYICVALTLDEATIESEVTKWVKQVEDAGISAGKIVLLGTKADKIKDEVILENKKDQLIELAKKNRCRPGAFITSIDDEMQDFFSETADEAMKMGLNPPSQLRSVTGPRPSDNGPDLLKGIRMSRVGGVRNLTVRTSDAELTATLKSSGENTDQKLQEENVDPVKTEILALIDARIKKIESTRGVFKSMSPEKINAWKSLYGKLHSEPNVADFRAIIDGWENETQTRGEVEVKNSLIINEQRSTMKLFESSVSKSQTVLTEIRNKLPPEPEAANVLVNV